MKTLKANLYEANFRRYDGSIAGGQYSTTTVPVAVRKVIPQQSCQLPGDKSMKLKHLKSQEDWRIQIVKAKSVYLKLIPIIPIFLGCAKLLYDGSIGGQRVKKYD